MNSDKTLIAISTDGNNVALVKSVNSQTYKELLNAQERAISEKLEKENAHQISHAVLNNKADHFIRLETVLAKSIYDNFVDRGLLENDDKFQQMWFDFYFNGCELDFENAPQEYMAILEKVREF